MKGLKYILATSLLMFICVLRTLDMSAEILQTYQSESAVTCLGVPLGTDNRQSRKILKKQGYKLFCQEIEESLWGGNDIKSYYEGLSDDYPVTIEVTALENNQQVYDAEVQYHNHVDMYEVDEHLQDIVDEIKSRYPYTKWEESTPEYYRASSLLRQKSGKNRIFKNITIVRFRGHCRLYGSPDASENDFYGTITIEVHDDPLNHDLVIRVSYNDRNLSTYIRQRAGEFRW